MISWKNFNTLAAYGKLETLKGRVRLAEAMAGESGAERVAKYSVPMACGMSYNFAAKAVDDEILGALDELAQEAQLTEKYACDLLTTLGAEISTDTPDKVMTRGDLAEMFEAE